MKKTKHIIIAALIAFTPLVLAQESDTESGAAETAAQPAADTAAETAAEPVKKPAAESGKKPAAGFATETAAESKQGSDAPEELKTIDLTKFGFKSIGQMKTRSASEIQSSMWSIGGETLDRDFAVYDNYKSYLGKLGAKGIRLQCGWAKCEKQPGVYSWDWLDKVVDDSLKQGVQPWLQTSYGNPIYPGGGTTGLGGSLPTSPEALKAWDNWVHALARRYKDRVKEWEIWNEPDLNAVHPTIGLPVTAEDYAKLFIRTAEIIRKEQPEAKIYGLAMAGSKPGDDTFALEFLIWIKVLGKTDLLDAVTVHGYPANPDEVFATAMQKMLKTHAPKAAVRQGETGAPSSKTVAALNQFQWTENKQAKWNLRRMMQHNGRNIPFNLFTMVDLKYAQTDLKGMNRKGLLFANDDMTVARPKLSYLAAQNVFSIFDNSFNPAKSLKAPSSEVSLFSYQKKDSNNAVVTAWISNAPPTDSAEPTPKDITIPGVVFTDPVYVDLISGKVYRFPKDQWSSDKKSTTFTKLPLWDCPIAIAEASLIPLK